MTLTETRQSQPSRREIGGITVLSLPHDPYVEVEERIRAVHQAGKPLSVEQGEILTVHAHGIYRAHLLIDAQRYIGDADLYLAVAPVPTEGSTSISDGQLAAIGQALTFAGFGDLQNILARLGHVPGAQEMTRLPPVQQQADLLEQSTRDRRQGETLATRLLQVYQSGAAFGMERCELLEFQGIWAYRVRVSVNGQSYLGDAEIDFETPDPVSRAQRSAVEAALGFAGFGKVCSRRAGSHQQAQEAHSAPGQAPALAVSSTQQQVHPQKPAGCDLFSNASPGERSTPVPAEKEEKATRLTAEQRGMLQSLCQRLGEPEPLYDGLTTVQADQRIVELQYAEAELWRVADRAVTERSDTQPAAAVVATSDPPSPLAPLAQPVSQASQIMDVACVRDLKQRWRSALRVVGTAQEQLAQWRAFGQRICGAEVEDRAMTAAQYERLLAALPTQKKQQYSPRQPLPVPSLPPGAAENKRGTA